jgi:hypothetical protein
MPHSADGGGAPQKRKRRRKALSQKPQPFLFVPRPPKTVTVKTEQRRGGAADTFKPARTQPHITVSTKVASQRALARTERSIATTRSNQRRAAKARQARPKPHHDNIIEKIIHTVYGGGEGDRKGGGPTAARRGSVGTTSLAGFSGSGLAKTGRAAVIATGKDPVGVPTKTVKGLAELAVGSIAALPEFTVRSATHPLKTAKELVKTQSADWQRRYGGSMTSQIERIRKEGAAPEVADVSILLGGAGTAGGRVAGALARGGRLGARAERLATEARPVLRVAGGKTRSQEVAPNLIRAAGQRAEDRARVAKARRKGTKGLVVKPGEVAPIFSQRAQRIAASELSSRANIAKRNIDTKEIRKGSQREFLKLNKAERKGVWHAVQGMVDPSDPVRAADQLRARRDQILAERARRKVTVPARLKESNDEIALIDELLKAPHNTFTPKLREFVDKEAQRSIRVAGVDASTRDIVQEARRLRPQAQVLGIPHPYTQARKAIERAGRRRGVRKSDLIAELDRRRPQLEAPFIAQVRAAARREGLPEPAYVKHYPRPVPGRLEHTTGQGSRAMAAPKQSGMALLKTGTADVRPETLWTSLAETTRRGVNWELTDRQARTHAIELDPKTVAEVARRRRGQRRATPDNLTPEELRRYMDKEGLDPADFSMYQPGRLRRNLDEGTDNPLQGSFIDANNRAQYDTTSGWYLVPKEAATAMNPGSVGSSFAPRALDKMMGIQSATLLGTSPGWLQAQVAANAFVTGFGIRGNVADIPRSVRWYRGLPKEQRDAVDEILGTGVFEHSVPRMGSALNESNRLVNGWRALKTTPFMMRARKANPLDLLFRADDVQNKLFKRAVLYNRLKREGYKRMGQNVGKLALAQQKVADLLDPSKLSVEKQMAKLIDEPEVFENQAKAALSVLGDYSRYTYAERKYLKRGILFYGFLRYSIRTAFYTLPIKHPLATAITAELANLHNDEVRDIVGGPEAPWAYSRIFFDGDKLKSIDLARISPVSSPILDFVNEGPKAAGSLISPLGQVLSDQIYGTKLFTGRQFTGHGSGESGSGLDMESRARIALDQTLGILGGVPYRVGEKATQGTASQTDAALLWSPDPIKYKTEKAQKKEAERRAARGSTKEEILPTLLPFVPKGDTTRQTVASRQEQLRKGKGKRRRRRKPPGVSFGGGGGGGVTFGGGGSSGGVTFGG